MILQHSNWRTVEEWRQLKIPMTTPSNEASKMFDASLTQLVTHYDDPSLGGISTTMDNMLKADPNFVMGLSMSLNLRLMGGGTSVEKNPELKQNVDRLLGLAEKQPDLAPCERKHAQAVKLLAERNLKEACVTWEDILLENPLDMLALKLAYIGYITLGDSAQLRDSVARVLPHWPVTSPFYGDLLSMHAFGLEETNMYDRAEKQASKALELNQHDAWATHTLSHVYEMTGQQKKGIQFLENTVKDWEICKSLACHNWWHCCLHHVEQGNFKAAMELYENELKPRCLRQRELFNLSDAASLLFRLEIEGLDVSEQWKEIMEVCEPYLEERTSVFYDVHLLMTCTGAGDKKAAERLLDSVEKFVREEKGTCRDVHSHIGAKICKAVVAYRAGDFAGATNIMYPLRYQIINIGGSHAQRDLLHLFLIMSAIQSSKREHHRLARTLLAERKALKENSPLTDRLVARVMALHSD